MFNHYWVIRFIVTFFCFFVCFLICFSFSKPYFSFPLRLPIYIGTGFAFHFGYHQVKSCLLLITKKNKNKLIFVSCLLVDNGRSLSHTKSIALFITHMSHGQLSCHNLCRSSLHKYSLHTNYVHTHFPR